MYFTFSFTYFLTYLQIQRLRDITFEELLTQTKKSRNIETRIMSEDGIIYDPFINGLLTYIKLIVSISSITLNMGHVCIHNLFSPLIITECYGLCILLVKYIIFTWSRHEGNERGEKERKRSSDIFFERSPLHRRFCRVLGSQTSRDPPPELRTGNSWKEERTDDSD